MNRVNFSHVVDSSKAFLGFWIWTTVLHVDANYFFFDQRRIRIEKKDKILPMMGPLGITVTIWGLLGTCSSSSLTMSWCNLPPATSRGKRSMWSVISRFAKLSSRALQASKLPSRAARNNGVSSCKKKKYIYIYIYMGKEKGKPLPKIQGNLCDIFWRSQMSFSIRRE